MTFGLAERVLIMNRHEGQLKVASSTELGASNELLISTRRVCAVFVAWGPKYVRAALSLSRSVHLRDFDKLLITDRMTDIGNVSELRVLRVEFELNNNARKAEPIKFLPPD